MNRAVPLSQFMPYGAPDLLAAGPSNLSRAVIASSLLAVAAFSLVVMAAWLWPDRVVKPITIPPIPHIIDNTEILPPPKAPPSIAPVVPRGMPKDGLIQPIPDDPEIKAGPIEPPRAGEPDGREGVNAVPNAPVAPVAPEVIPDRHAYIYSDELPITVKEVKPEYPEFAKQVGVEGLVLVHVYVGKDGRVAKAEVDDKRQNPMLNDAALQAARRWVFTPAYADKHPVAVWITLPFRFTLH